MPRPLAILMLALLAGCARPQAATITLTVSVAASLQNAITEVAARYPRAKIEFNFGGSGALARQIANGAPVDVFLSAAPQPMDDLARRGLILAGTRRDLLRNEIVLITWGIAKSFESLARPTVKVIALGDPDSVPAGDYGRQVLKALHLWDKVQPKLVLAKDVRQVLSYVESGNADAGIVYATDARSSHRVRVAAVAPPNTHTPVVYPVAVIKGSRNPAAAREFAAFLAGPQARAIFEKHGFSPVAP